MSVVEEVSDEVDVGKKITDVVVRFAGDSGDGMQLTGSNFTEATALYGNDLATFPDFPAEIRAPAGATFGVSAFQIYFGSEALAIYPSLSNITGVLYLVAIRTASIATSKQSDEVEAEITGKGVSPWRPKIACSKSDCSVFVGKPVEGPPR